MEIINCKDMVKWNDFVSLSPQGCVFCKSDFLDSLDVDYEIWIIEDKGSPKIGAVILKDKGGNPIEAPYDFTQSVGLLYSGEFSSMKPHHGISESLKVLDFLLAALGERYDFMSFSLSTQFQDMRSLLWFNYHQPELGKFQLNLSYTGLINLKDCNEFNDYLLSISKSKRYEYRKGEKSRVTTEVSNDIGALEKLYVLTFERQNIAVTWKSIELMRSIISSALSLNYGNIFICKNEHGEVISATFFLHDEYKAYYLIGANHPDYRNTGSSIYLLLESIRHYYSKGMKKIDVCGINSPSRGGFKTSLNAIPTPYFVATWKSSCIE